MLERFKSINKHWESKEAFLKGDKHLYDLNKYDYLHVFNWWEGLSEPAVHLICGPRQLGKTTSIKQYINSLIDKGTSVNQIIFLNAELFNDYRELRESILFFLNTVDQSSLSYIFIDELTFLKRWDVAIKSLIDEGAFRNSIVVLTSSDSILLEEAALSFPGINRRGHQGKNIKLTPLNFSQFLKLVYPQVNILESYDSRDVFLRVEKAFYDYLQCGGFPNAINHHLMDSLSLDSLYSVYSHWILGDFIRKGKSQEKLIDLLNNVVPRLASSISYNRLAQACTSLSTDSVKEYLEHLERLGVLFVLSSLNINTLAAYPKKDKKIHFFDPFILRVVNALLESRQLVSHIEQIISESVAVEGVVASHLRSIKPTFYYNGRQEIDVAFLNNGEAFFIEVKWRLKSNPKLFQELLKMKNRIILDKGFGVGEINGVKRIALVSALANLDQFLADEF